ncbi:hypothetical protein CAPTEDRAFT_202229 [Capitella teleta]|uniref:Metalloendopeptidase n=1 Tax=Capitella teleta TaxID=283909 RepID=R7V0V5_CAPTE|nr:hypothetical protein CAPTEDRAFT_202229 [Capitella teleta]|eukprot:ELU12127.1 hypothetical protein CAPTEDRAFT_202229 [Capitella teleta]
MSWLDNIKPQKRIQDTFLLRSASSTKKGKIPERRFGKTTTTLRNSHFLTARVIRNSTLWQPSDGTSREDWLRCHGFPCDKWQRTKEKITKLKYMVTSDGERTGVSEIPPDIDASDDSLDGCIWVTEEQIDDLMEELEANWKAEDGEQKIRKKRKLADFRKSTSGLWDLPIAWKFFGSQSTQQREIIRGGFDHVEQQTCVRFKELGVNEISYGEDHLLITRESTGCHSLIGHTGYAAQKLNMHDDCMTKLNIPAAYRSNVTNSLYLTPFGTTVHEIVHALGFYHEHQRADRDQHIRVRNGNIRSHTAMFIKLKTDSRGLPYDVGSVMHYRPKRLGSYYLYIEASRPRQDGDTAKLLLPATTKTGTKCMQFHYNMHGSLIGSLVVFSLRPNNYEKLIWYEVGDKGKAWQAVSVEVALSKNDRLILVGTVGKTYFGDIAIDDLQIFEGICPK